MLFVGVDWAERHHDVCLPDARPQSGRRGKQGRKRSTVTDGGGIPLGTVAAGANRHDSPLLDPTLDTLDRLGPLPPQPVVHLDAGYDSDSTRMLLDKRGMTGQIATKGKSAPV